MLTALAVVALMTGTVVVFMGTQTPPARDAGNRLVTRLAEAREYALVSGQSLGFAGDADQRGWRFFHAPDGVWQVMETHPGLEPTRLETGVSIIITEGALPVRQADEDAEDVAAPQVLFDPTGFDQPFTVMLRDGRAVVEVVRGDRGELLLVSDDSAGAS
jgi:hypothetical protein